MATRSIGEDLVALMQKQEEFYLHLEPVSLDEIEINLELLKNPVNQDAHTFNTFVKEQSTISKINALSVQALESVQYQIKKSDALAVLQQVNQQQTQLARFLELKEMLTQIIEHSVLKPESFVKLTMTEVNLVWIQDFNSILTILDHLKHRPHWQVTGKVLPNVEQLCKYGLDKLCSYLETHFTYIKDHPNTNITIRHQRLKMCSPALKMVKKTFPDTFSKIRQEYFIIVEQYYLRLFSEYIGSLRQSALPDHEPSPFSEWLKTSDLKGSEYYIENIDELLRPEKYVLFISPNQKITNIKIAQALLKVLVDTWSSERSFLLEFFALSTMSNSKKEPRHPDYDVFKGTHTFAFNTIHQLVSKFTLTNLMVVLQTINSLGNATPISKQELRISNLSIETTSIIRKYLKELILFLETNEQQLKKSIKHKAEYDTLECPPPDQILKLHGTRCMADIFVVSIHINSHGIIFTEFWDMLYHSYQAFVSCLQGYSGVNSSTILHHHSFILTNLYFIDVCIRQNLEKFDLPQKERHFKIFDQCVDDFCKDMLSISFPGFMSVLQEFTSDQVEAPTHDLLEQISEEFGNQWRNVLQDIMQIIPMCFAVTELSGFLLKKFSEYFLFTYSSYLNLLDRVLFNETKTSTTNSTKRYPFKRQPQPMQSLLVELKKYNVM
eukprot:NODE_43_length_33755_cov_1.178542.p1 type:complete len:666 gc:universal NODE_43_length_33755_cov_1.178542:10150-12147(+)